jgi:antitoxin component YwqK of YwqJK toxin-antitoxin module
MTLTHDQAQHILKQAKAAKACAGQYKAAAQALKRNDLEGFERICRASHRWLAMYGIDYTLTDGLAEGFYPDGTCSFRCTYKGGRLDGLAEEFYPDGTCSFRCPYKNGIQQ